MGVSVNIDKTIEDYKKKGGKTSFENSLRQVLEFAKKDENIKNVSDLAYLLGTAKEESDYSLQRWESDYVCSLKGKPYIDKPCASALNYYRSTQGGKKNYYTLGTDKNGLPYFGRGLIQLTGKSNYQKYGDLIGVDLVKDGDKALEPKNSFKIATTYLSNKRGGIYEKNGVKRNTFDMASDNDLTIARKSVNGGSKGLEQVNNYYNLWKEILQNNLENKTNKNLKIIFVSVVSLAVVGLGIYVYFKLIKAK